MRRNETSGTIYANFRFKGKLFRHSLKTSDKTTARNQLATLKNRLEAQAHHGSGHPAKDTSISEIAPRFLASLAEMSKSDQIRSKGHMKFFMDYFGPKNPRDLSPMEIKEWMQKLRDERGFVEDSWNKYAATFYKFYEFLKQNSYASDNPMEKFDFLKGKATRKYTPTTKEVQAILAHIKQKTYFPERQETLDFIEFMALTGQGRAEAVHAQWMDVCWSENKINFYRQKTRANAHAMPLSPALATFLSRRLNGRTPEPTEPIFKVKDVGKAIDSACNKLGIPKMGHHSFRRYFITQRLMEGVPPNIVAKWVGHRTSEMVMEVYASIPNAYEVSFADKIPAN
jgi:integrase